MFKNGLEIHAQIQKIFSISWVWGIIMFAGGIGGGGGEGREANFFLKLMLWILIIEFQIFQEGFGPPSHHHYINLDVNSLKCCQLKFILELVEYFLPAKKIK